MATRFRSTPDAGQSRRSRARPRQDLRGRAAPPAAQANPSPATGEAQASAGHPRRWAILAVLVVSLVVVVLDNTVLNVAMRTITDPVRGLGASQADMEWAINSYTLVFAGLLFTAGILGDRYGRRRMLVAGLVLFGLASLASAYSQSPGQLIWARALMGIGAAAILPSTLSIISNVFDPRERGRAIGIWAGAVGLGVAIGPVVGGALLERFWWGSVFLINVPVIVAGLVAIALVVPESRDRGSKRIDVVGVLASIVGLVALVYGIIDGGDHGFGRATSWGSIVVGLAVLAGFVRYEARIDHPSLDVRLFRNARFFSAVGAVGLVFFAAMGTLFFLAFYFQLLRHFSPLQAGLLMTPFAAAQLIFAPRSAAMVKRFGPRAVCTVGLSLVTVGLIGFAFVGATTPIWVLLVLTFVQGAGMANVVAPATEAVMSSLPRERAGVGSAISNTFRQVGGALGVAILGSVLSAVYRGQVSSALAGLPGPARDVAAESISGAYGVASHAGAAGPALIAAADRAFVVAMHWAAGGSAIVAVAAIVTVVLWMPRRPATVPAVPEVSEPVSEVSATSQLGHSRRLPELRVLAETSE
jgi:EmrB/QacA subfamily drug resistance transporter